MAIADLVRSRSPIEAIGEALDALDHRGRLREIRALGGKEQAALFEMAAARPCALAGDVVPAGKGPLEEVIHWGKNSLPLFTRFQKRFCWPSKPTDPPVAYGYNEQAMKWITGPGYFIAREAEHDSGVRTVVIDYYEVPTEKPNSWPPIKPNSAGLSRAVYQINSWLWKVSGHVSVGRVKKPAGWQDNWFVLCRED